jgi:hypothetical protein
MYRGIGIDEILTDNVLRVRYFSKYRSILSVFIGISSVFYFTNNVHQTHIKTKFQQQYSSHIIFYVYLHKNIFFFFGVCDIKRGKLLKSGGYLQINY